MFQDLSRIAVILPTLNAEQYFDAFASPLLGQGIRADQVLIVDSESQDKTVARALSYGFQVHEIQRKDFNHGGTRRLASALMPWANILVYMTQDAVIARPDSLATLVAVFDDPQVGAAYGRHIPHRNADPFACHACNFNYPERSVLRDLESKRTLGFKTIFFSNVFGAYRRTALEASGNFPPGLIYGEDTWMAAKMMLEGWKTAYVAEALVSHSHNFTLSQIFRRYFDTGAFHAQERWLFDVYGTPSGEGIRYVQSEINWVARENPFLFPKIFFRTAAKYLGYKLGLYGARFSDILKKQQGTTPKR